METIKTPPASKKYRDNYDRTFRHKKPTPEQLDNLVKLVRESNTFDANIDWGECKEITDINQSKYCDE
jgi:hypothetical protein